MTDPAFIICFALLLIFSIYIGFLAGNRAGEHALTDRAYWLYNVAEVALCVFITALVPLPAMLYATPLGLLAGALMGLKMGYGESVGPWKAIDRFYSRNRAHQRAAETGSARARRARRRAGEREPDLISVESRNTTSHTDQHDAAGAAAKRKKR